MEKLGADATVGQFLADPARMEALANTIATELNLYQFGNCCLFSYCEWASGRPRPRLYLEAAREFLQEIPKNTRSSTLTLCQLVQNLKQVATTTAEYSCPCAVRLLTKYF